MNYNTKNIKVGDKVWIEFHKNDNYKPFDGWYTVTRLDDNVGCGISGFTTHGINGKSYWHYYDNDCGSSRYMTVKDFRKQKLNKILK